MAGLRGKHILIVEDEGLLAVEFATSLAVVGAAVVGPAHTCSSALAMLRRHDVDAAVLDVTLENDERVYPVAEYLHDKRIPFLFVTGGVGAVLRRDFAKRPMLSKPFTPTQLVAALEVLLD